MDYSIRAAIDAGAIATGVMTAITCIIAPTRYAVIVFRLIIVPNMYKSVGRLFSTIVGFVEARRMVMIEGNRAIAGAVSSATENNGGGI